jgi:HAD superfamily hydrolase (TIGR01484 family)
VPAVFTDFDGTLTIGGALRSSTLQALERAAGSGLPLVIVTGRPAGYGELMARTLPVMGVIAENGGMWFRRKGKRIVRGYAEPGSVRGANRRRLERAIAGILEEFPGAALSSDCAYTEVDMAIDHAEDRRLPTATVDRIEAACHRRGLHAVRSNVHINCWVGDFDKLSTSRRFARAVLGLSRAQLDRSIYLGDSINDAPMFGGFPLSIGVGNVKDVWAELPEKPAYVVEAREGRGAEEVLNALIVARS